MIKNLTYFEDAEQETNAGNEKEKQKLLRGELQMLQQYLTNLQLELLKLYSTNLIKGKRQLLITSRTSSMAWTCCLTWPWQAGYIERLLKERKKCTCNVLSGWIVLNN
jgi:hypothetical protein